MNLFEIFSNPKRPKMINTNNWSIDGSHHQPTFPSLQLSPASQKQTNGIQLPVSVSKQTVFFVSLHRQAFMPCYTFVGFWVVFWGTNMTKWYTVCRENKQQSLFYSKQNIDGCPCWIKPSIRKHSQLQVKTINKNVSL